MGIRPPQAPAFNTRGQRGPLNVMPGHGRGQLGTEMPNGDLLPIMRATPLYPPAAERRELEGRVTVEFTVMPDGTVADVGIVHSTHPIFDRAALDAAARFRYQPRYVDGTPIAVAGVRTVFDFQLEE
jgi:protein TonB